MESRFGFRPSCREIKLAFKSYPAAFEPVALAHIGDEQGPKKAEAEEGAHPGCETVHAKPLMLCPSIFGQRGVKKG